MSEKQRNASQKNIIEKIRARLASQRYIALKIAGGIVAVGAVIGIILASGSGGSGKLVGSAGGYDPADCPPDSELFTWYLDADGDGFGDPENEIDYCEQPEGYVADGTDCDDADPEVHGGCGKEKKTTWYADRDGDGFGDPAESQRAREQPEGYVADGTDCDDADPEVHGVCGKGDKTAWYADLDGDGFGDPLDSKLAKKQPKGYVADGTDCNDADPNVLGERGWYPDADGDGYVDPASPILACEQPDGFLPCFDATCADCDDTNPDVLGESAWYPDADGDGYVDSSSPILACEQPDGFLPCFDATCADCDDTNPDVLGESTWYPDADGDGYVDPASPILACEQPDGFLPCFDATCADCDDSDPGVGEECVQPDDDGDVLDNDYDKDLDGILDSTEKTLMETFAPVMWLYSDDPYRPASVEWLFQRDDASLMMQVEPCISYSQSNMRILLNPIGDGVNLLGFENEICGGTSGPDGPYADHFYIDPVETDGPNSIHLGDMYSAPYYATVSRDPYNNKFAINYWFFYVFNGCGFSADFGENCSYTHEGDWEHVTVYVEQKPDGSYSGYFASFYYHGDNSGYWWDQTYKCADDPNRICAFSAKYTHATYYKWGEHDSQAKGAFDRRDYCNNGIIWDPLKGEIVDWKNDPGNPRPMDLPQGGIINVGQKPLNRSRSYFDPSMGVPMPGMEWILFQGRWGIDGSDPPGPGTPNFQWYENQPGDPPSVWKVPDQQAEKDVLKTFDLGKIIFFGGPISYKIDWGDGNILEGRWANPSGANMLSDHTYTAPGEYFVNITVVDENGFWGGNVFKVTVSP